MSDSAIRDHSVVAIHFSLRLDDGNVVDSTEGNDPFLYLHGHGNIVQGLEEELLDKSIGAKLDVSVPPEKGFGERREDIIAPPLPTHATQVRCS